MAIYDIQRNSLIPAGPFVPEVDPVLGVGQKPTLRSILSRMQGPEFASASPTLPYRPTVGSVFKDALSGFFGGVTKGNEGKRELEESEAERANRAELTKLTRERTQAEVVASKANIEQEAARTALAQKSSNASALKLIFDIHTETGVPTDIIAPIVQQGLSGDIDAAGKALGVFSQASGLGEMGQEYFGALLGQMEDQRSPEAISDALKKSSAFVQKHKEKEFGNLLAQEELLKLQRKVAEKNLQKAEKEAELGASPEVIASMAGDLLQQAGVRENIAQDAATKIAAVSQAGAGDIASMLLSGDATQSQTALRAVSSLPEDSPIRTLADIVLRNQAEADSLREAASTQYARIGQGIPTRAVPAGQPTPAPSRGPLQLAPDPASLTEFTPPASSPTAAAGRYIAKTGGAAFKRTGLDALGAGAQWLAGNTPGQKSAYANSIADSVLRDEPGSLNFLARNLESLRGGRTGAEMTFGPNRTPWSQLSETDRVTFLSQLRASSSEEEFRRFVLFNLLPGDLYMKLGAGEGAGANP